jgi:hypothetical protein
MVSSFYIREFRTIEREDTQQFGCGPGDCNEPLARTYKGHNRCISPPEGDRLWNEVEFGSRVPLTAGERGTRGSNATQWKVFELHCIELFSIVL